MENQNNGKHSDQEVKKFIELTLGKHSFGIPLLMVREVISVPETTPIPKAPPHFKGIMNLRGQVISIVDLRQKMKIKPNEDTSEESVVIVDIGVHKVGVIVDSIDRVLSIAPGQISENVDVENGIDTKYILGIYRKENSLTILMDIAKILDVKDLELSGQAKAA